MLAVGVGVGAVDGFTDLVGLGKELIGAPTRKVEVLPSNDQTYPHVVVICRVEDAANVRNVARGQHDLAVVREFADESTALKVVVVPGGSMMNDTSPGPRKAVGLESFEVFVSFGDTRLGEDLPCRVIDGNGRPCIRSDVFRARVAGTGTSWRAERSSQND